MRTTVLFAIYRLGKVEELRANMTELRSLRFVCSKCGSRVWRGWLLFTAEETTEFREGRS